MSPVFTVFTPTYNRRDLLPRVYDSLRQQTWRDFEWLIVDDGSSDGTGELVREWQRDGDMTIRFFYQGNRGRHCAFNRAVQEAAGAFFVMLDSDDACVPRALERLLAHWNSIPPERRGEFSGVTVLCRDQHGNAVGRPFPRDIVDCPHFEIYTRYGATGEKWGFHRTEVLRRFAYPEIDGERWCADALLWNRIGVKYKMRHVNEALKIYWLHPGMLSHAVDRIRMGSPRAARLYYKEYAALPLPLRWRLRALVNYVRYSFHAHAGLRRTIADSALRAWTAALVPGGYLAYVKDVAGHGR